MGLSSQTSRIGYTGNGSVSVYAYTFKIFDDDDLLVTVRDTASPGVETTLVKTTDYTVSGVGSSTGGNVTLVNASQSWLTSGNLKSNYKLVVRRVMDLIQSADIRNQGDYYPETHENVFDMLVMQDQQQQDDLDRSVKLPETLTSATFDPTLPTDINTASRVLVTNEDGDGWEVGLSTSTIAEAITSAAEAAASASDAADSAAAAASSETAAAASAAAAAASATAITSLTFGSEASPRSVVAGTGIVSASTHMSTTVGNQLIFAKCSAAGNNAISANPQIQAHTVIGAKLRIIGMDSSNAFTLDDGTGLKMASGTWYAHAYRSIEFIWTGTYWLETGRDS